MILMYDFVTLVGQDSPLSFFISPEWAQITVQYLQTWFTFVFLLIHSSPVFRLAPFQRLYALVYSFPMT